MGFRFISRFWPNFWRSLCVCALLAFLNSGTGCALAPTRVTENPADRVEMKGAPWAPSDALLLDVRPAAVHLLGRVPKSRLVRWFDFHEPKPALRGYIAGNVTELIERLARWGAEPDRPVVVITGPENRLGEAEQLAWTLLNLGLRRIQINDFRSYRGRPEMGEAKPSLVEPRTWALADEQIARVEVRRLREGLERERRRPNPQIVLVNRALAELDGASLRDELKRRVQTFDSRRAIWLQPAAEFQAERVELLGRVAWNLRETDPRWDIRVVPEPPAR
jgi:hypothetical protein